MLTIAGMVTSRIGKGVRPYLYVDEWIDHRGLSNEVIADRLGRDRATIWRWRENKRKLTPEKQAELAAALNIEPEDLWHHPDRPSVNELLKGTSDEFRAKAREMIKLLKTAS